MKIQDLASSWRAIPNDADPDKKILRGLLTRLSRHPAGEPVSTGADRASFYVPLNAFGNDEMPGCPTGYAVIDSSVGNAVICMPIGRLGVSFWNRAFMTVNRSGPRSLCPTLTQVLDPIRQCHFFDRMGVT